MTKRLALALGTRDTPDLSARSIEPLMRPDIDLWVMDGSKTDAGLKFVSDVAASAQPAYPIHTHTNITGGADAAIVYALTTLLNETDAPYVGWCESDCLLHTDWLGPTLALFERGADDGLLVGAISARAYTDRILCQRDGYALMHNLGAGNLILTRKAAQHTLNHYRSHWTTGNAKVFHQLCGIDIRKYWAFRGFQHFVTVDWGIDTILAAHGLASLALTPSPCEMIGQNPPLTEQGLTLAAEPVELLRNDDAFRRFADLTLAIRKGQLRLPDQMFCRLDDGTQVIFPHQLGAINGQAFGQWRRKWQQGFGPFAYVADEGQPFVEAPLVGPCTFVVSGGKTGGKVSLVDTQSGYEIETDLDPEGDAQQATNLAVPGNIAHRTVRLTALTSGVTFYGIQVSEPQPTDPSWTFDHGVLPKP